MNWINFFQDVNKKEAISWAFYDFANSAYTILILSFVFPIFFREEIAGGTNGDFWWGLSVSVSILLGGLSTPIIGAMSDLDAMRKRKFIIFSVFSIVGTALLFFTGSGNLIFAMVLFILTNLCFEISQTLYDSFLPQVSTPTTSGRISGLGWGLGYLGGIIALLALRPLYANGYEQEVLYKFTFPLVALFFLIFSLPAFFLIKETSGQITHISFLVLLKKGVSNTLQTIKNIRQYKQIAWFLAGFYILNDALVTILAFVPIYAKATLEMTFSEITFFILCALLTGFPSATFFGWLSDKKGSKKILLTTLILWMLIITAMSFATSKIFLYVLALPTGMVIGSSQAITRSWFSKIIPREKTGEFFGFNGFASKVAATTGPLMFGTISWITANQRIALGLLVIYFILSLLIFIKVEESK